MFLSKKVLVCPIRKTLGRYNPGPGGQTIDEFHGKARKELGKSVMMPTNGFEVQTTIESHNITIEDAFDEALQSSTHCDLARRDWNASTDLFKEWLKAEYPHIKTWT